MDTPRITATIAYPAAVDSVITRVLEAGSGPETVLFVHGVAARADRWARNLPVIGAAGYRCLALDLPGHGFAQKGAGLNHSVPGYADFVQDFIESQGLERVHLVGTSLGAHVVATVACRCPTLVHSLTLVGAVGLLPVGEQLREMIAQALEDTSLEGIRRKLHFVFFEPDAVPDQFVTEEWRINNSPGAAHTFAALADYFRLRLDEDVVGTRLAASADLPKPLVVWGEDDLSTPLQVGIQVSELLGVPLACIVRAGHVPYWEAPEEFNRILIAHLAGASAPAAATHAPVSPVVG